MIETKTSLSEPKTEAQAAIDALVELLAEHNPPEIRLEAAKVILAHILGNRAIVEAK